MKNFKSERGIGLMPFIWAFIAVLVIAGIVVGVVIVNKNLNRPHKIILFTAAA